MFWQVSLVYFGVIIRTQPQNITNYIGNGWQLR